jgi:class 3 adenylate cyclase
MRSFPAAPPDHSVDALLMDLETIAGVAVGDVPFILHGQASGGFAVMRYAVAHPERLTHLILDNTTPGGPETNDPERVEAFRSMLGMLRVAPEGFYAAMAYMSGVTPEEGRVAVIERTRRSIEPLDALDLYETAFDVGQRDLLPRIASPTLVLHMDENRSFEFRAATYMADRLPGATLVRLPGVGANLWEENTAARLGAIGRFVGRPELGAGLRSVADQAPTVIIFTDTVSSTELTRDLGDVEARRLFPRHDAIVSRTIEENRGSVVKHTGDGLMATFPMSELAVRAAVSVQKRLSAENGKDPHIRIAIHTGNAVDADDVFGLAVVLTSRIIEFADAGQILVTPAVTSFATGEDLRFVPAGTVQPKGFEEPVEVPAVEWRG